MRAAPDMGELAATTSPPPPAVLPVVFVDGEQSVDLGTVTVQGGGVKRLQAVVADRVGVAPHQISASLARPRRARRVPLDDATDLAAAVAREGSGCYVVAGLRRSSRRDRRGGRSRRDRKGASGGGSVAGAPAEKTILKRLPPTDLASLVGPPPPLPLPHAAAPPLVLDGWGYDDYEARLRELQRQRDWYLMSTAEVGPDPSYFHLAAAAAAAAGAHPEHEDPAAAALWSPRRSPSPCPECEAAAAAMRRRRPCGRLRSTGACATPWSPRGSAPTWAPSSARRRRPRPRLRCPCLCRRRRAPAASRASSACPSTSRSTSSSCSSVAVAVAVAVAWPLVVVVSTLAAIVCRQKQTSGAGRDGIGDGSWMDGGCVLELVCAARQGKRGRSRSFVSVGASHSSNRPSGPSRPGPPWCARKPRQRNGTERNSSQTWPPATGGCWTDTFALSSVRPAAGLLLAVENQVFPFFFFFLSCGMCVPEQCGMGESRA